MKSAAMMVLALTICGSGAAVAHGHGSHGGSGGHSGGHTGHGGHHRGHFGHGRSIFFVGAPLFSSQWFFPRYYDDPKPGDFLLYCPDPAGYYPEISSCPVKWWRVIPDEPTADNYGAPTLLSATP